MSMLFSQRQITKSSSLRDIQESSADEGRKLERLRQKIVRRSAFANCEKWSTAPSRTIEWGLQVEIYSQMT